MAILDNYLPCEDYAGKTPSENFPGFLSWFNDDDQHWYFSVVTNTGRVVLRSEGYTSEAGRDNGMQSVMRNRDIEERYRIEQDSDDGNWYVILVAGNRQEIARSCPYGSEAEAIAGRDACYSTYTEREVSANRVIENYLACEAYAAAPDSEAYPGFKSWYNEEDGQYYFAVVTPMGRVVLRSEGYTTEAARDNGIQSVIRNRDNEERYRVVQDEADGKWYVILRAGNNQEIARSCAYDSEADATAGIAACFSTYSDRSAAAPREVDNYLDCETYAAAPNDAAYPGFKSWYNEADGQYYFAAVTPGGRVVLRSEGYTTDSARNNGIESVMRNRDIENRYKVIEEDGQWYVILRAGNNQEIGRSCAYDSEAAAMAGVAMTYSTYSDVVEERAARAAIVIEDYLPCEAYSGKSASKYEGFNVFTDETSGLHYFAMVDDNGNVVLKSEGYTTEASRDNGIESVIRNRDNKDRWVVNNDDEGYYYSLRAGNHQEIARTCHYDSESALMAWWMPLSWSRRGELVEIETESSLESMKVESTVVDTPVKVEIEEVAAPIVVPEIEVPKVVEEPPVVEVAAAVAAAAAFIPEIEVPKEPEVKKEEYVPSWKKKEEKTVVYTKPVEEEVIVPPPVTQYTEPTSSGGGWWKWLLPLLLLGLLAWFLLRGCDGCKKPEPPAPPPPPKVEVPTPAPATPPPPPPPSCKCTGNEDALFNISATATPKSLTRLGTNPEFGNSHGLSPEDFYKKLKSRADASSTDKKFLDRVFKGMGYADGFAAAKPEMFSAVEVRAGTVGNMGYSKAHKTVYARLDAQGDDLKAFRIKSSNGCDFHFMKTCGNHFFFCPN